MSRRRRHFKGLGSLTTALDQSVKPMDVLVGAGAGLAGIAAAKWGYGKLCAMLGAMSTPITLPDVVGDLVPALGAAAAGAGLYLAQKGSGRGAGHLAGALAGGLTVTAGGLAAKYGVPGFGDVVSVNLSGLVSRQIAPSTRQMFPARAALGLVTQDPRRQGMGLITANAGRSRQLGLITPNRRSQLARVSGVRSMDI